MYSIGRVALECKLASLTFFQIQYQNINIKTSVRQDISGRIDKRIGAKIVINNQNLALAAVEIDIWNGDNSLRCVEAR